MTRIKLLTYLSLGILLQVVTLTVRADDSTGQLQGTVKADDTGKPLKGVIVRINDSEDKILAYTLTKNEGQYTLTIPDSTAGEQTVTFEKNGYDRLRCPLATLRRSPDVTLLPGGQALQEVVVMPSPIIARKDTIIYSVDAIRNASDRTIEDVISHLPGINVTPEGIIKYNGESINRFYIEGLDMLQGRYSLATRNIRADDVASVDVYQNHQPVKALKDIAFSDKAALNLKLKKKALIRPSGYITAGAGAGYPDVAWKGELYAMFLAARSQTFVTAKATDFGEGYELENRIQAGQPQWAGSPLTGIYHISPTVQSAPVSASRYTALTSQLYSVTSGIKLSQNTTLSATVSYNNSRTNWHGISTTTYTSGDKGSETVISQDDRSNADKYSLLAMLGIEINSSRLYLSERVNFRIGGSTAHSTLANIPPPDVTQQTRLKLIDVVNDLALVRRHNGNVFDFYSTIAFTSLPHNYLSVHSTEQDLWQHAMSRKFTTTHSTSFSRAFGQRFMSGLQLKLYTDYLDLDTYNSLPEHSDNRQHGISINLDVGPYIELKNTRFSWRTDIPLNLIWLDFGNLHLPDGENTFRKMCVNIGVRSRLNYRISYFMKGSLSIGRNASTGGLTNFVDAPLLNSYNAVSVMGDGALRHNSAWSAMINLEYTNVISGLFGNLRASGRLARSSAFAVSNVSGTGSTSSMTIQQASHSRTADASATVSKLLGRSTTLRAGIETACMAGRMMRNANEMSYTNATTAFNVNATLDLKHLSCVITPKITCTLNTSVTDGNSVTLPQYEGILQLAVFPHRSVELKVTPLWKINRLSGGEYRKWFFLDASARYTFGAWQTEVTLANITDRRMYSATSFSPLMTATTAVWLRGFEALASVKYSF
ncbi:MAG: carboxypeptidase-like regulatory domain-containing protein [Muribaculaceae bacterium]|nr:carboxypeptidase-like regulatory domain-containing protein [Muribaculaceae bacterium]